ncbi:MAG TPA: hypothetical protein VKY22_10610 [Bradyrhizobium sp.]|nr:hypothetical protein [Bradyrhizobium sp.]
MLREFVLAVPALIVCLLISSALFGPDERAAASVAVSSTWIGADSLPTARWIAKDSFVTGGPRVAAERPAGEHRRERDVTPEARIKGVFAQFVPGESGHPI